MFRTIASLILVLLLTSCGISPLSDRESNPVIEDRVGLFDSGPIGIIATKADRRAIVFRDVPPSADSDLSVEFCAEPPPDVASDTSRKLAAELAAQIQSVDITTAKFENFVQLINRSLLTRSQGLQLFRDGLYNVCVLYLNRIVGRDDAKAMAADLLQKSYILIAQEIEKGLVPPIVLSSQTFDDNSEGEKQEKTKDEEQEKTKDEN